MSHPFYKSAKNTSGLPGRVPVTSYEKLKKFAHDVWDIDGSSEEPVVVRKREETAELNFQEPEVSVGDIVLLLLGGHEIEARVQAQSAEGLLSLHTSEGDLTDIPQEWVTRRGQGVPLTAEDPLPAPTNETTDSLQRLLQNRGGHIAVRLSQSTVLELHQLPQGLAATLWETSTRAAHRGTYQDVGQVVQELGLTGYPSEVPVESLQAR